MPLALTVSLRRADSFMDCTTPRVRWSAQTLLLPFHHHPTSTPPLIRASTPLVTRMRHLTLRCDAPLRHLTARSPTWRIYSVNIRGVRGIRLPRRGKRLPLDVVFSVMVTGTPPPGYDASLATGITHYVVCCGCIMNFAR